MHPWCQELGRLYVGGWLARKSNSATSNTPQTHLKRTSNASQTVKKLKKNNVEKVGIYAYISSYTSIYLHTGKLLTGVETNGSLDNGLAVGWFGGCWVGWLAEWLSG